MIQNYMSLIGIWLYVWIAAQSHKVQVWYFHRMVFNPIYCSEFYDSVEASQDEKKPNHLVLAITSDRGLCGAVNSSIVKTVREVINTSPSGTDTKVIAVGEKAKSLLQR